MDGRGGAVAFVQRFDAALNLNVHIHAFVLDGVFTPDCSGGVSVRAHERHDSGVSVFAPRRWTRCARADKQRQAFSRQALLRTMQNSAPAAGPRH